MIEPSQRWGMRIVLAACVAGASVTTGCATLVEAGLSTLADGERAGAPSPGPSANTPSSTRTDRPSQTANVYQVAPTLDWRMNPVGSPYTPSYALFGRVGPGRVTCQAVPVGLAQAYSGPTGPAETPLFELGPLSVEVAGPDGVVEDLLAWSPEALAARAFRSGARMAGNGPLCGNRLFFFVRIGSPASPVAIHR